MTVPRVAMTMLENESLRTSAASAVAIMQELNRLRFMEQFETMAPLIRQYLEEHGVTFPKEKP